MKLLAVLPLLALSFSSCSDLMEVRTVKMKKPKKRAGFENSPLAGQPRPGFKGAEQGDGIQVGKSPAEEIGTLPTKVGTGVKYKGYELPSDDRIVWSDDSKPDADIKFDQPFKKARKNRGDWQTSFSEARRQSQRTGKPLLIWFTNKAPGKSPLCKRLSNEVFSKSDFRKWADTETVRVLVDFNAGNDGSGEFDNEGSRKQKYVTKLKKRFKVLGLPTLVVLNPAGEVVDRYRGYRKGNHNYYFQRIKDRVLTVKHNHKIWRQRMEAKGYREWTGQNGRRIFARLVRYQKGRITLVEPDGTKSRTKESELSLPDQEWIKAEKAKRARS